MEHKVDPELERALDRLADKMNVGEGQEAVRDKRAAQRRVKAVRRNFNRDGHYTRHNEREIRAAAEEAARRYR